MQASRLLARSLNRIVPKRNAHHHHDVPVQSTYNDLPQPSGSWQTAHDAKQRKYNLHLVLGVGILASTLVVGKSAGLLESYSDIPERPAKIDSYKD